MNDKLIFYLNDCRGFHCGSNANSLIINTGKIFIL